MTQIKHTPGPWESREIIRNGLPYVPVYANTLIAKVYSTAFKDDAQAIANAKLMAAAPELVDILAEVRDAISSYWVPQTDKGEDRKADLIRRADAALDRAMGLS